MKITPHVDIFLICSWKRCTLHASTLSPWYVYSFLILMSTKIWSASSLQWVTALISSLRWSRVPVWGWIVRMVGLLDRQPQQKLSGQGQGRDKSDSRLCPPRTHLGHPSLPHPSLRSFLWCLPTSILSSLTKVGGSLGAQCHQLVGAGINGVVTSPLLRVGPASKMAFVFQPPSHLQWMELTHSLCLALLFPSFGMGYFGGGLLPCLVI